MTRSIDPLFDPRLADWLEDDDSTAPEQALEIVLASFPSIKQRRAWRVPWRTTSMTSTLRLGLAAAVVIAAALGSVYFLGSRSTAPVAGPETPTPTVAPSPTAAPSDSPAAVGTTRPNWTTFTSPQYGYTVDHPLAFQAAPATEAWPLGEVVGKEEPWVDKFFSAVGQTTFVGIASQQLPEGLTAEAALTAYQQQVAERFCAVPLDAWTDTTVLDSPAIRAEFSFGDSPAVEYAWINGDRGWVISGNPDVVELMLESFEYE
ncbi:MAG TPA: hypothetical protein VFU17_08720 [Candidatus Limnocylindrales bacterium]|nr:hypothetical protein [Candidatus Limnocylindrales bacterium]